MRKELECRSGKTIRVRARIERYGTVNDSVYLLTDVCEATTGHLLTDHLWMPIGEWAAGFRMGDIISFDATVEPYVKGYFGRRADILTEKASPSLDYHLVEVQNAVILVQGPIPRMV